LVLEQVADRAGIDGVARIAGLSSGATTTISVSGSAARKLRIGAALDPITHDRLEIGGRPARFAGVDSSPRRPPRAGEGR
jgi:hypothetical protein